MDRRKFIGCVGVLAVGSVLPAGEESVPGVGGTSFRVKLEKGWQLTEYEKACQDYVRGIDPYHMDVATWDREEQCWVYSRSAALEECDRRIVAHYKSRQNLDI